ncbi:20697_t:CDS:2, partial [Entrophospora sp. SA101]
MSSSSMFDSDENNETNNLPDSLSESDENIEDNNAVANIFDSDENNENNVSNNTVANIFDSDENDENNEYNEYNEKSKDNENNNTETNTFDSDENNEYNEKSDVNVNNNAAANIFDSDENNENIDVPDDKHDLEIEDLFGAGGSGEDDDDLQFEEKETEKPHSKEADIQIFGALPHTRTNKLDLIRMPRFFTQSYTDFDPKTYNGENESNYYKGVKLAAESSIRWRYNKRKKEDDEDEIIEKETNTKLVKWSDGSKTLHIGKEAYLLNSYEFARPRYIAIAHKQTNVLEFQSRVPGYSSFTPNNLHSLTHKRLTAAIQAEHKKQMKTKYIDFSTNEKLMKEHQEQQRKGQKAQKSSNAPKTSKPRKRDYRSSDEDADIISARKSLSHNDTYVDDSGFVTEKPHSKEADIQIFGALPHTRTNKLDLIRMPRFFTQSYTDFDPKTYNGENESNYYKGVKLAAESSIRWRYNKRKKEDDEDEIIEKETNTKLVKWSDGSKTLHIGKEAYLLNSYEFARPRYIAIAHKQTNVLEFQSRVPGYSSFTPNNLHSLTHKRLTAAIQAEHKKQMKTKYIDFSTNEKLMKEHQEQQRKGQKAQKSSNAPKTSKPRKRDYRSSDEDADIISARKSLSHNDTYVDDSGFV